MTYLEHRAILIRDLLAKAAIADWHGVSDAANDLRVLEARNDPRSRYDAVVARIMAAFKPVEHWFDARKQS